MESHEVIEEFCKLSTSVAREVFKHSEAADCFCGNPASGSWGNFQFSEEVLSFIKDAVKEKIENTITFISEENNNE